MKVFRLFFKIVWTNRFFYFMYVAILVSIFYFAMRAYNYDNKPDVFFVDPVVGINNQDKGELGQYLTEYLEGKYRVREIPVSEKEIQDQLFGNQISFAFLIKNNFSETVLNNSDAGYSIISGVEQNINDLLVNDINQYLSYTEMLTANMPKPLTEGDARWVHEEVLRITNQEVISSVLGEGGREQNAFTGLYYFLLQIIYSLTAIGFVSVGKAIVVMEKPVVKIRDMVSGYSDFKRTRTMLLAGFSFMIIVWLLLIAIGFGFVGTEILTSTKTILMLLSSFVHLLTISFFFVLFANLIPSERAMSFFSTIFSVVIGFACGVFVPRELIADGLVSVSRIFPSYWEVSNQYTIAYATKIGSEEISLLVKNMAIMLSMGLGAFVLTILIRRIKARNDFR